MMDIFSETAAAVRVQAWRQQPSFTRCLQALRRFLFWQTTVQALQTPFSDEEAIESLQLIAPGELLAGEGLAPDTSHLLARLETLFPIHQRFTEELLSQGNLRVVPEPLGYQLSWESLVDFCENPGAYYPEIVLPWLFWVSGEVRSGQGEEVEENVLATWEFYTAEYPLAGPFPRRFLEPDLVFDWPGFAARLYDQGLLPFYTLTAALLNDTGNFFFDEDFLDQILNFPICAESLEGLRDEYREARKLQEVIDLALHRLREEPEILGEIIRILNLCWKPVS